MTKLFIGSHKFNILLGVIGMLVASTGNLITQSQLQKEFFLVGALFLLASSVFERQIFFIILQVIIVAGAAIALTPLPLLYKAAVPILLSLAGLLYFIQQGLLKDTLTLIGCIGIGFLAAGYAITEPVIYLLGAITLAIYSFGSYRRGVTIGIIWGTLNVVFALTALVAMYHFFLH